MYFEGEYGRDDEQADALAGEGVLLLSPGAPSFGVYKDYVARGKHFAEQPHARQQRLRPAARDRAVKPAQRLVDLPQGDHPSTSASSSICSGYSLRCMQRHTR